MIPPHLRAIVACKPPCSSSFKFFKRFPFLPLAASSHLTPSSIRPPRTRGRAHAPARQEHVLLPHPDTLANTDSMDARYRSISAWMMLSYCAARLGANIALCTYQHPVFCRNIQTASYSTTLAITGVATILIRYKTWEYRQTHLAAFSKMSHQTRTQRTQKIMLMLVESGVIYMLFLVVQVVMSLSSVNQSIKERPALAFAMTTYQYIPSLIVGIYPTVVVVLVNLKHSVLRSESEGGTAQGGIKFKSTLGTGTTQSTYLNTNSSVMSMSALRGGLPATTVDLYEMLRVSSEGKVGAGIGIGIGEVLKDPALTVRVQQSAATYHV
ncbi:hypothetical protein ONZ51_g7608 [Trametes cubensis]|uniref:Uncharacterized protein n=1 Tax=Trametes cubensis TaxID=1111947 RepID=A0AAD7XA11_9APHY|nr:hypothetical protein ONZ51_g7608 [Trametes cubensis]